jgi:hypothetical protein
MLLNILHSSLLLVLAIVGAVVICLSAESLLIAGARIGTVNYLAYRLIGRIIMLGEPNRALTWLGHVIPVYSEEFPTSSTSTTSSFSS